MGPYRTSGDPQPDPPTGAWPVLPQIGCLTCGVVISGLAKVGHPCPFCDDTLRDLELEILTLSTLYDGARWCFLQFEAQRR